MHAIYENRHEKVIETLTDEDVARVAEETGAIVPERLVDEVLRRAAKTYGDAIDSLCDTRFDALDDAIASTLRDNPDDGDDHTAYTCPACGNRDRFRISTVVTVFSDVEVTPDGWDWFDADSDGCDAADGAVMTCCECGHAAQHDSGEWFPGK